MAGSKISKSVLIIHLKAVNAQFNQKSDFKSDLSRVVRFEYPGYEGEAHEERGQENCVHMLRSPPFPFPLN